MMNTEIKLLLHHLKLGIFFAYDVAHSNERYFLLSSLNKTHLLSSILRRALEEGVGFSSNHSEICTEFVKKCKKFISGLILLEGIAF